MVKANIVKEQDGIPMLYKEFKRGFGIRVVHPQNPKAPSKNMSVQVLYVAPGGSIAPHQHENEEVYILVEGKGRGYFGMGEPIDIEPITFFHLPANAEHGVENTGDTMMKLITATAPPFPIWPEWEIVEPKKGKPKKK